MAVTPADSESAYTREPLAAAPRFSTADVLRVVVWLLVITQLGFIPFLDIGSRKAPIFVNDIAVMAFLGAGTVAMVARRALRLDDVSGAALAFTLVGFLAAVAAVPHYGLSPLELIASLAYLARWVVYFAIYVVAINCLSARDVRGVWRALENTLLLFAAFGVFQSIFLPNFGQMIYPDAKLYIELDPQGHRLMSTMLEPNIAAAMIGIVLLVQLAQLAAGVSLPRWKPTLLLVALVLTLSRSGALAFLCGVMVIVAVSGLGRKMTRFLTGMFLLALLALAPLLQFAGQYGKLGMSDSSATARLLSWQRAILTFLESPWYGIGFNTYGFVQQRRGYTLFGSSGYSSEGGLLFIAVMTGVIGLAVYCAMLWFALRRARRLWRDPRATPEERGMAVGCAAATIAVCVHSMFVNSLLVPFVMEMLWLLWAFVFLLSGAARSRQLTSLPIERRPALTLVSV